MSNVPEIPTATRYIRLFPKQPAKPEEDDNSRVCLRLSVIGCENGMFFLHFVFSLKKDLFLNPNIFRMNSVTVNTQKESYLL